MPQWIKASFDFIRHPRELKRLIYWEDQRSETRIILHQPILLILFFVTLIWYLLSPTKVIVLILVGVGGILAVSFYWIRQMARNVDCSRRLHYTAFQVGDELEEQVWMKNFSPLPVLWAEFIDHSNIPDYTVTSVQAAGGRSTQQWRAGTICKKRGIYTLGPWEVVIGEPFDIFHVIKKYRDQSEIIVYPPLTPVPPGIIPNSNAVGSHKQLQQPVEAETILANSTRQYLPGDPLRRIHWKTTARRQSPFVKIFEPEGATSVWLIPDFDARVQAGEGVESTLEAMVILVASIASDLLDEHLSVGLFLNSALPGKPEAQPVTVLPRYGRTHIWTILRALAPVEAANNRPFTQTLSLAHSVMSSQDMLIVVTPSLDVAWIDQLKGILHHTRSDHRGLSYTKAVVVDPSSFRSSEPSPSPLEQELVMNPIRYLAAVGIPSTLIKKSDIKTISGAHGALRRWEFKTLGTGRVVVRQAPRTVGNDR